ncbi:MAG: sporulation integral membrane protein YtvI [Clostridia bacterium]|nr:sporulation integral membrane protein YtvI [Clostridia bacterium]
MKKERIEYYAHLTVTVVGASLAAYVVFKYLLVLVLPFLIAWGVAFSLRPLARAISEATKIPNKIVAVALTLLIVVGGISLVGFALAYSLGQAWDFLSGLIESDALYGVLAKILNPIGGIFGDREGAAEIEAKLGEAVKSGVTSILSGIVHTLTEFAAAVPRFLIFLLITVIASVYFSLDLEKINSFVIKLLPKSAANGLIKFKNHFLRGILGYLRSYLILMVLTFVVMLFGFVSLRVKYAVLFAFIVALLDALPLIGVGTVLVPWSVYQLAFGDTGMGIGLIVLFVSNTVFRQFIEPRIVGRNLGIHPIASLLVLYVGYCLFGIFGLLTVPLVTVLINLLFNKNDSSKVTKGLVRK